MSDRRSEFASIISRANSHALSTIVELDFSKRTALTALYNELGEKTLELFFPSDLGPIEPPKSSSSKPKKAVK